MLRKPKKGRSSPTLDQFLDFDEQVLRGEIKLDSEEQTGKDFTGIVKTVNMDSNGQIGQVPVQIDREGRTTNIFGRPIFSNINRKIPANSDDEDSSSSESDCDPTNCRKMFRSLTVNTSHSVKSPESSRSSASAKSISSSGGSQTSSSSTSGGNNDPLHQSRQTRSAIPDFSSLYYPKPKSSGVTGIGRGRGRGRGSMRSSGSPSDDDDEITVDILHSPLGLDSDDSNPDIANENGVKKHPLKIILTPSFSSAKLIDNSKKISKYKNSTISDFPGRVLTRGPLLICPLGVINHFEHYRILAKGIKNCGLTEFNSLQKSVAPHFSRGDDCFITGGVGSGKSLSYLIPLVGKLLAESIDSSSTTRLCPKKDSSKTLPNKSYDHQPAVIIVCSSKRSAIKIDGHLFQMLSAGNQRQLSIAVICERKDLMNVHKGVDIIITSVHFFSNLLKSSVRLGFEKMRFFVFEDIDILLGAFRKEFDNIQDVLTNVVVRCSRFPIQRIFCGKDWCSDVEDLYMALEPLSGNNENSAPTVFINSPNQAIKYAEMQWFFHHCSENKKIDLLLTLLKSLDLYKHKSVFVVCSTAEIAMSVQEGLRSNDVCSRLAETATMTQYTFNQLKSEWEDSPSDKRIIVLNDEMLRGLKIYDVTCLINYDMPLKQAAYIKSSTGADRFSCMWTHFRNVAMEKVDPSSKHLRLELVAHFLLTGKEAALYKLKTFAETIGCSIPESLRVIANEMENEMIKKLPICNGIKEFGRCVETAQVKCKARHAFLRSELEKSVVPKSGEIEVRIAECVNPTTYTAQVLRCYEHTEGKKRLLYSWIQNFKSISQDLVQYFEVKANRNPPSSFNVGSLCAVENSDGIFRSRIVQIYTRTERNYPKQLKVFCIDSGHFLQPAAENLFSLPLNLQELPQLAVELILANLQPLDGDNGYGSIAKGKGQELTVDKILNGRVQFAIGETVWVNSLVDLGRDALDSSVKTRCSIRQALIKNNCAENNENHMKSVLDLCRKTGYHCPELDDAQSNPLTDIPLMLKFYDLGDPYDWAFVATSTIENPDTVEIWTSFTKNPHCIFGTNGKFDAELGAVNAKLNETIAEMIGDRCADYATQFFSYYQKGMVVAVKDRIDKSWHRGMITDVVEINESCVFNVFFVDIGDEQKSSLPSELFPILRTLVSKLPFQAIAFELSHITPVINPGVWKNEAIDQLMCITLDENLDGVMFDVVALQTRNHESIPCRYYSAFMITPSGDDVGEILVAKGCANFVKDDKELKLVKKNILSSLNMLYDRHRKEFGSDDEADLGVEKYDDESDPENALDIVGYDKNTVMNALGMELSSSTLPSLPSELNDTVMQLQAASTRAAVAIASTSATAESCETPDLRDNQLGNDDPVSIAFSTLKHPNVYWRQTRTEFILKIDHPDILDYSIVINKKQVIFRTRNPPDYGFDIETFGTIEKTSQVFCTGQYLKITLKKRTQWPWPRPLIEPHKFRWLKEDVDNVEVSDDELLSDNENYRIALPDEYDTDSESDIDVDVEDIIDED